MKKMVCIMAFAAISMTLFAQHPNAVDLGLSVKWADRNIGAATPQDFGNYYAWGETVVKSVYADETYKWLLNDSLKKYCVDGTQGVIDNKLVLDACDDAAIIELGGAWQMPTRAQITELLTQCTWKQETKDGVKGYKVTGRNGKSIFLPAAGFVINDKMHIGANAMGSYWSSRLYSCNAFDLKKGEYEQQINVKAAAALDFSIMEGIAPSNISCVRMYGCPIRPVVNPLLEKLSKDEQELLIYIRLHPNTPAEQIIEPCGGDAKRISAALSGLKKAKLIKWNAEAENGFWEINL